MNRFDIADAHFVLESDYNKDGWLSERPSNKRRMESTGVQLHRMKYSAPMDLCFENLEDDGKEVYMTNVLLWKLPIDDELKAKMEEYFMPEFLIESGHSLFSNSSTRETSRE